MVVSKSYSNWLSYAYSAVNLNVYLLQHKMNYFCAKAYSLQGGDHHLPKKFSLGEPWLHGTIHSKTGPVSFTVEFANVTIVNRPLDQLREDVAANVNGPSPTADCNDNAPLQMTNQHLPTDTNKLRHSKRDSYRHPSHMFS